MDRSPRTNIDRAVAAVQRSESTVTGRFIVSTILVPGLDAKGPTTNWETCVLTDRSAAPRFVHNHHNDVTRPLAMNFHWQLVELIDELSEVNP